MADPRICEREALEAAMSYIEDYGTEGGMIMRDQVRSAILAYGRAVREADVAMLRERGVPCPWIGEHTADTICEVCSALRALNEAASAIEALARE